MKLIYDFKLVDDNGRAYQSRAGEVSDTWTAYTLFRHCDMLIADMCYAVEKVAEQFNTAPGAGK